MASRKMLLAALLMVLACVSGSVWAQDTTYARGGDVWSAYEEAYPTSYSASAAAKWHYGAVIDCRRAQALSFAITVGTGCGVTTNTKMSVEWLVDNPENPVGPYAGVTYTFGYPIDKWYVRRPLTLCSDATGGTTTTVMTSDDYLATCTVLMPYARLAVYTAVKDGDQCAVGVFVRKRYAPWVPAQ